MTREEAIQILEINRPVRTRRMSTPARRYVEAFEMAISALKDSKNKGEWIKIGEAYVCSRCSTTCAYTETADKWIWHTNDKFCRGCGADMRGET